MRGVVVSDDDRVLLVKWRRSDGARFWICPGGGVEDDESDDVALARELLEETSLSSFDAGPHIATWNWSNGYEHRFYLVRCPRFTPATGDGHPETEVFEEFRWWSAADLDDCPDLGPEPHLRTLLQGLLAGRLPTRPLEWRSDPSPGL